MIEAIFYARFDLSQGPTIRHAFPRHRIWSSDGVKLVHGGGDSLDVRDSVPNIDDLHDERDSPKKHKYMKGPLVDFSLISDYVIPQQEFCGQILSLCVNNYRIIGYPMCIVNEERYERNEFNYNFCVVVKETQDDVEPRSTIHTSTATEYESYLSDLTSDPDFGSGPSQGALAVNIAALEALVQKLALASLEAEENGQWLSLDQKEVWTHQIRKQAEQVDSGPEYEQFDETILQVRDRHTLNRGQSGVFEGHSAIESVISLIWHQLNNFGECDVDLGNTVRFHYKLCASDKANLRIQDRFVPVARCESTELRQRIDDLTQLRLIPFINGVNSVKDVARTSQTQEALCKQAMIDLSRGGAITLIDKFLFGGIYAATPAAKSITRDLLPFNATSEGSTEQSTAPQYDDREHASGNQVEKLTLDELRTLYWQFQYGMTLESWVLQNFQRLKSANVDVRSFIVKGLISGILTRVHKWPIHTISTQQHRGSEDDAGKANGLYQTGGNNQGEIRELLDGRSCLDDLCASLESSEADISWRLTTESSTYEMIFK